MTLPDPHACDPLLPTRPGGRSHFLVCGVGIGVSTLYGDAMTSTTATATNDRLAAATFAAMWDAPMSDRGWCTILPEQITLHGLVHGTTRIIHRRDTPGLGVVLTCHVAGGAYWSGRGSQGYAGASIITVLFAPNADKPTTGKYVVIDRCDIPRNDDARGRAHALYHDGLANACEVCRTRPSEVVPDVEEEHAGMHVCLECYGETL